MEVPMVASGIAKFSDQAAHAASLLRALSNESRLLVLCHLAENEELSAGELVERLGLSQSALSQHLSKLREEKLVATRKEAQHVFYRIADPRARQILSLLHDLFCPELGRETSTTKLTGDKQ
jgi:DNA-binding transcriptional ArsR family regulator